jgi:Family of unknown function (DUF6174)
MDLHRVAGLALLLLAVAAATRAEPDIARNELAAARARWAESGIDSYEIRFRDESCFCLFGPYYGPIRNVVWSGKLRTSYYEGERRDGYWHGRRVRIATSLRATVEDVFARVERLVSTAATGTYRVEYDPKFGFPVLVEFDDPAWEDEQWRLVSDGFKPLGSRR